MKPALKKHRSALKEVTLALKKHRSALKESVPALKKAAHVLKVVSQSHKIVKTFYQKQAGF